MGILKGAHGFQNQLFVFFPDASRNKNTAVCEVGLQVSNMLCVPAAQNNLINSRLSGGFGLNAAKSFPECPGVILRYGENPIEKIENGAVKAFQERVEVGGAGPEHGGGQNHGGSVPFCGKEVIRPEVVTHQHKYVGLNERCGFFCIFRGVCRQIEYGVGVGIVFLAL